MSVELLPPPSPCILLPGELSPKRSVALFPLLFAGAVFLTLAILFSRWNASNAWAFPQFVLVTLVVLYLPGRLLAEWGGFDGSEAERMAVGMCLALVLAVVCWMGLAELGWQRGFVLWPIGWTAAFACRLLRVSRPSWAGYEFRREHLLLGGLLVAVGLAMTWMGTYYHNAIKLGADRGLWNANLYPDLRLHLSIANELTHTYPPEIPFLAGVPLRYHIGMDVLPNLYLSVARFEQLDLYNRFLPTLLFGLLTLGAYCLGKEYLGSRFFGVCFAALLVFGNDFYSIGCLLNPALSPSYHLPTLNSLFFHNPNLHGMTVLMAGLVALIRFVRLPTPRALWPVAVLFAGTMLFKVFLLAGVLGALGIVGVVRWGLRRERRALVATGAVLAAMVPLAFLMRHGLRNGNQEVGLWLIPGLENPAGFFLVTLGMRLVALPALLFALVPRRTGDSVRFFFAAFIVVGTVLGLVVNIRVVGTFLYNGYWFYLAAKYLVWLFVLETVQVIPSRLAFVRGGLLACTLTLAIFPSVLFFKGNSYADLPDITISPDEDRLFRWLRTSAPGGSVVMPDADSPLPLSTMTKCRTLLDPFTNVFAPTFLDAEAFASREADCKTFWDRWDAGDFRSEIASRYRVDFLLLQPARRKADPLAEVGLRPAYDDGTYRVYDLRRLTPAGMPSR